MQWQVYSTAVGTGVIMVQDETGRRGYIEDYTEDEWRRAFYAPVSPYPWHDPSRVIISSPSPAEAPR